MEFRLKQSEGGALDAEYRSDGETARFRIVLSGSTGAFVAAPGSQPGTLVKDLCRVLEAVGCPAIPAQREPKIEFRYSVTARNAGRSELSEDGSWVHLKLSLGAEGDEDPEAGVHLNYNPKEGLGEFLMKDPDDGYRVVKTLARVL